MRDIDQDLRDENDEAKRRGVPVATIAERRHMEVAELCVLMQWPQWQEIPVAKPDDASFDLFRTEELDGVL